MAHYEVKGSNKSGKDVKIFVESDSPKGARSKARSQGVIPISVKVADAAGGNEEPKDLSGQFKSAFKAVNSRDLMEMTRQLASLVKAHVPIVESLSALIEQVESPGLRPILMALRQSVKEGNSLGDSFAQFPKVFNRIYVNMVRSGEASGRLDVVLLRLADFSEYQEKMKTKIGGAMTYPIIMIIVGILAMIAIFTFVVPQITQIFSDLDQALPWATQLMIAISELLLEDGLPILIVTLCVLILFERYLKSNNGRRKKDSLLLKAPLFKNIVEGLCVARFSRTLGTLLASGVPMINSLKVSLAVVNNSVYEDALEVVSEDVSEGRSLAFSLKKTGIFPPIVVHMVNVGEKTGELEGMLMSIAESYDQQIESKLGRLVTLLEPIMIILLVGMVGFVVMAVLLPIFEMQNMV